MRFLKVDRSKSDILVLAGTPFVRLEVVFFRGPSAISGMRVVPPILFLRYQRMTNRLRSQRLKSSRWLPCSPSGRGHLPVELLSSSDISFGHLSTTEATREIFQLRFRRIRVGSALNLRLLHRVRRSRNANRSVPLITSLRQLCLI